MPPISKPEVRFKEESGIRFLVDGKIRCHALAKSKMRKWREAYDDYDAPTDNLWPECQCGQGAEEGQYVCRFHGGKTPRPKSPPRTMLDVMPLEMAEKFKAIMDSPEYISRKDDINLLKTRIMMLLEELNQEASNEESWGYVHEALVKLRHDDLANAEDYLKQALTTRNNKKEVWKELYKAEKLLGDMTTTQMRTAKELQSLATAEQVNGLITTLIHMVLAGAQEYISDPAQRSKFTQTIATGVQRLTGTTIKQVIDAG